MFLISINQNDFLNKNLRTICVQKNAFILEFQVSQLINMIRLDIMRGIPQGTTLGPPHNMSYINDNTRFGSTILFSAEETTLFVSKKSMESLFSMVIDKLTTLTTGYMKISALYAKNRLR